MIINGRLSVESERVKTDALTPLRACFMNIIEMAERIAVSTA